MGALEFLHRSYKLKSPHWKRVYYVLLFPRSALALSVTAPEAEYIYHLSPWRKAFVELRQRRKRFIFSFTATAQLVCLGKKTLPNMTASCWKEEKHNNPRRNNFVLKICTFFKHEKPASSSAFSFLSLLNDPDRADMSESTGHSSTSGEHSVAVNRFKFPNGSIFGTAC